MDRPSSVAFNRPRRVFGFHPQALISVLVALAVGIMMPVPKLAVAVGALVALGLIRRYGSDPVGLIVLVRALFQKARYEPTRRDVFRLEIK
jgi:hypothetical protein